MIENIYDKYIHIISGNITCGAGVVTISRDLSGMYLDVLGGACLCHQILKLAYDLVETSNHSNPTRQKGHQMSMRGGFNQSETHLFRSQTGNLPQVELNTFVYHLVISHN